MGNIERGMNMTRETVIQNILTNYGQYISKEDVESMVDSGKEQDLIYDLIYLRLLVKIRMIILKLTIRYF